MDAKKWWLYLRDDSRNSAVPKSRFQTNLPILSLKIQILAEGSTGIIRYLTQLFRFTETEILPYF
jgi:hypothetical protein